MSMRLFQAGENIVMGRRGSMSLNGVAAASPPGVPTGLTPTGQTGSISLAFTLVSGATSYNVLISADGGSTYPTTVTGVTTSPYVDSTANAHFQASSGQVYYKMQAVNAAGTSASSSAVHASPFAFYDTFTGADSTSLASHALTIGPAGYTLSAGDAWVLNTNVAQCNGGGSSMAAYIDAGVNDCTISIKIPVLTAGDGYLGIAIRYQNNTNYYAMITNGGDPNMYLTNRVAGSGGTVAGPFAGMTAGDVLTINTSGNTIRGYRNGALIFTYNSATEFHSVNNFGLFLSSTDSTGRWDDLKITIP